MIPICKYKPRHGVFNANKPHMLVPSKLYHGSFGMFPPVQKHYEAVNFDMEILGKLGIMTVGGWILSNRKHIKKRNVRRYFNQFTKKLGYNPKRIEEWYWK